MKRLCTGLLLVLVMCLGLSCASTPAGFAPSTSPMEETPGVLGHATGSHTYFSLLGFIPFGHPSYDAAIKNAIGKVPGGTKMINARSWFTMTYAVIGYVNTTYVEGDVVK